MNVLLNQVCSALGQVTAMPGQAQVWPYVTAQEHPWSTLSDLDRYISREPGR